MYVWVIYLIFVSKVTSRQKVCSFQFIICLGYVDFPRSQLTFEARCVRKVISKFALDVSNCLVGKIALPVGNKNVARSDPSISGGNLVLRWDRVWSTKVKEYATLQ